MDSFFSSPRLFKELGNRGIGVVRIVNSNHKGKLSKNNVQVDML